MSEHPGPRDDEKEKKQKGKKKGTRQKAGKEAMS